MFKSAKKIFRAIDTDNSHAIDARELYDFMDTTLREADDADPDAMARAEMGGATPES